jgi:3-oxoacyl-[acyl-carrier protein] reductase
MKNLDGKVILVTGSGRGFGRSMAYSYAIRGAQVVAIALEEEELADMTKEIRSKGGEVFTIVTDLTSEEQIYKSRDLILEKYGRLDVIVNNAAACPWKRYSETTVQDWDLIFAVNLRAPFILSKVFFETLKKQLKGSIINITSRSAEIGFLAEVAFSPTKWGLEGLTQCLALELQPYNIAVNTLRVATPPGKQLKPTGMTLEEARNMPAEIREKYADDESMAEYFGEAWAFLALQDAHGVTGQRLGSRELADYLRLNGWDAATSNWRRKLTKAVYVSYDFPESARYQTPEGGSKENKFYFNIK